MHIVTAEQMQAADRHAIESFGIPSLVLMENAGAEVTDALAGVVADLDGVTVLVLCGTGNNGGDGMVVARRLHGRGARVLAALIGDRARLSPDAAHQWRLLKSFGVPTMTCADEAAWQRAAARLAASDVIVDALLGTGFRGSIAGLLARVIGDVNAQDALRVAVDVPSGLSGSLSATPGPSVLADLTVALGAPKICHVFAPAQDRCGEVAVADIGIPPSSLTASGVALRGTHDADIADLILPLAHRPPSWHKGNAGHVLVVGGAAERSGAAALAGLGALSAGAGLVTVAAPEPCTAVIAAHAPELMHAPLGATAAGEVAVRATDVRALLRRKGVVVIGPGLGTGPGAADLLAAIVSEARVPIVADADALNLLAEHGFPAARAERPLVLTPHPGEFSRIAASLGIVYSPEGEAVPRVEAARAVAERLDCVVVLKGFRTLIASPGQPVFVNPTGGPGLATGGSGDVLAGMLGALISQGLSAHDAALAATYLHGLCGDVATEEQGEMSLLASHLPAYLPRAIRRLLGEDEEEDDDDAFADDLLASAFDEMDAPGFDDRPEPAPDRHPRPRLTLAPGGKAAPEEAARDAKKKASRRDKPRKPKGPPA